MNIGYSKVIQLFFCIALFNQTAAGQIHFVNHAANGLNDGTSWENAYTDLQLALAHAQANEQIWVAQGTYLPSQNSDPELSFVIPDAVAVYGGFNGTETTLNQRNWASNITTLSGDLLQNDDKQSNLDDNSYAVIYTKNVSAKTLLDGFIVSGGHAYKSGASDLDKGRCGAAWFNDSKNSIPSSPTAQNCTFINNRAGSFGGAIYNSAFFLGKSLSTYVKCRFVNNHSTNDGGAVFNQGSFDGEASPTFENCLFKDNTTDSSGGAIFNNGIQGKSSPYIMNCIFQENIANVDLVSIGNAGAIYNQGNSGESNPIIINSLFHKNVAYSGGAIYSLGSNGGNSSPKIINSTFYANQAVGAGGSGGAVYNNANDQGGTSNTEISNSIFWGNLAKGLPSVLRNVESSPSISHSIVDMEDCNLLNNGPNGNLQCGEGMQYQVDPMFLDENRGDLHLLPVSPAVNAGNNMTIQEMGINLDLDASNRIKDGLVDLGVYELEMAGDQIDSNYLSYQQILFDTLSIKDTLLFSHTLSSNDTLIVSMDTLFSDSSVISEVFTSIDTVLVTDSLLQVDSFFITQLSLNVDSIFITDSLQIIDTLFVTKTHIQLDTSVYSDSLTYLTTTIDTDSLFVYLNGNLIENNLVRIDTTYDQNQQVHLDSLISIDTSFHFDTLLQVERIIMLDTLIQIDTTITMDTLVQDIMVSNFELDHQELVLKAFPNPGTKLLQIELPNLQSSELEISIYDLSGVLHRREQIRKHNSGISFDIQALGKGLYLIKVEDKTGRKGIVKFVKL